MSCHQQPARRRGPPARTGGMSPTNQAPSTRCQAEKPGPLHGERHHFEHHTRARVPSVPAHSALPRDSAPGPGGKVPPFMGRGYSTKGARVLCVHLRAPQQLPAHEYPAPAQGASSVRAR